MTYAEIQDRLSRYLAAESKILQSQEYTSGQGGAALRSRRAELADVRDEIGKLQAQLAAHPDNPANRNARRVRVLRPC